MPMLQSFLPYEEQKTLETICAHHHAADPELIAHLAQFCNWIHQEEAADEPSPPFLLVLLSTMGVLNRRTPAQTRAPAA